MADSKWIIKFSFLLRVLCNCQDMALLNLEETVVISCPSDNFVAVPADTVRIQAGEPDKGICLDPNHMPRTFPFYYTVSCESRTPPTTRELLMSREDIQLFQDLGGKFCLENRTSSDGIDQLLLGINLADISREKLNFSLTLVCRAVKTSASGGSVVETSALIEPRETTSLRFIPQGQNGNVSTEKGKRVKIAVLVALRDELENVTTLWSDARIACGPDTDVEVPECVYTLQVGIQVTWSCSITTNKSDEYTFQHRGKLYVVHLTVYDPNSTDPSPSSPPPQDMTAIIAGVVMSVIVVIVVILIAIIIVASIVGYCCSKRYKLDDIKIVTADTNRQVTDLNMANGGNKQSRQSQSHPQSSAEATLDAPSITELEDRDQLQTVEEPDDPTLDVAEKSRVDSCSKLNVKSDDWRDSKGSITESHVNKAKVSIGNNGHPPTGTHDRGTTELQAMLVQNENKSSGTDLLHSPVQNGRIPTSTA